MTLSGSFMAPARRGAALAMYASADAANAELDGDSLVLVSTKLIPWGAHVRARCAPATALVPLAVCVS